MLCQRQICVPRPIVSHHNPLLPRKFGFGASRSQLKRVVRPGSREHKRRESSLQRTRRRLFIRTSHLSATMFELWQTTASRLYAAAHHANGAGDRGLPQSRSASDRDGNKRYGALDGFSNARRQSSLNAQISEKHTYIQAIRSSRTPRPELSPGSAQLSADWIPIGRWRYNSYAENNVQKFNVGLNLGNLAIRSFAVRVTNNWADYELICSDRARLHGIDRSKVRELLLKERVVSEGKSGSRRY